jgi:hypothetical protein
MRKHQLELWARDIVERVGRGEQHEDADAELKADWIESRAAARRLAAHANAARGEPIRWLIGVDQNRGPTGVSASDLAQWWTQVQSHFAEVAPRLLMDLAVSLGDSTVVALVFETDRAPYVVKNPVFGLSGGGPVELEVPWREGTRTRTARREDLLRILVPIRRRPEIEFRHGTISVVGSDGGLIVALRLTFYVVIPATVQMIVPHHRCELIMDVNGTPVAAESFQLCEPENGGGSLIVDSDHAILSGPSAFALVATARAPFSEEPQSWSARIMVTLRPALDYDPIQVRAGFSRNGGHYSVEGVQ